MSTITTYTRKHFDPVHPDPGLLCVEDFAHALPMICRGNGHVTTFWSGESTASAVRKRLPRAAIPGGWCWRAFCMTQASATCRTCRGH